MTRHQPPPSSASGVRERTDVHPRSGPEGAADLVVTAIAIGIILLGLTLMGR